MASAYCCSAWPTPATLPWPKIPKHPAKKRCSAPSRSTYWFARKRTSAWAIVSRTVLNYPTPASSVRFPPLVLLFRYVFGLIVEILRSVIAVGTRRILAIGLLELSQFRGEGLHVLAAGHHRGNVLAGDLGLLEGAQTLAAFQYGETVRYW